MSSDTTSETQPFSANSIIPWKPLGAKFHGSKELLRVLKSFSDLIPIVELWAIVVEYCRFGDRLLIINSESAIFWQPFNHDKEAFELMTGLPFPSGGDRTGSGFDAPSALLVREPLQLTPPLFEMSSFVLWRDRVFAAREITHDMQIHPCGIWTVRLTEATGMEETPKWTHMDGTDHFMARLSETKPVVWRRTELCILRDRLIVMNGFSNRGSDTKTTPTTSDDTQLRVGCFTFNLTAYIDRDDPTNHLQSKAAATTGETSGLGLGMGMGWWRLPDLRVQTGFGVLQPLRHPFLLAADSAANLLFAVCPDTVNHRTSQLSPSVTDTFSEDYVLDLNHCSFPSSQHPVMTPAPYNQIPNVAITVPVTTANDIGGGCGVQRALNGWTRIEPVRYLPALVSASRTGTGDAQRTTSVCAANGKLTLLRTY